MLDRTGFIDIPGYEGLYAINNVGDIYCYSKQRPVRGLVAERIMGKYKESRGYTQACFSKAGKRKFFKVHRLVAAVFIPNPSNKPYVNHKDGNKRNNRVDNLEWCTCSENHKHAYDTGLRTTNANVKNKSGASKRKISFEEAECIRRLYKTGKYSQAQLGRMFGMFPSNIRNILIEKTYKVEAYQ